MGEADAAGQAEARTETGAEIGTEAGATAAARDGGWLLGLGAAYAGLAWVLAPAGWVGGTAAAATLGLIFLGLLAAGAFRRGPLKGKATPQRRRGFIGVAFVIWGGLMIGASFMSILPKCQAVLTGYNLIEPKKGIPDALLIYSFQCADTRLVERTQGFTFLQDAPEDLRGRLDRMRDSKVKVELWSAERERRLFFPLGDEWVPMAPAQWRQRGFFKGYGDAGTGFALAGIFMILSAGYGRRPKNDKERKT